MSCELDAIMEGKNDVTLARAGVAAVYRPNGDALQDKEITVVEVAGSRRQMVQDAETTDHDEIRFLVSSVDDDVGHIAPTIAGRAEAPDEIILNEGDPDEEVWYVWRILIDGRTSGGMHDLLAASNPNPHTG